MKPKDYIETFQKIGSVIPIWNSVFLIIKELSEQNKDRVVQLACVKSGQHVMVDGVIGKNTIKAIAMCEPDKFLIELGKLLIVAKENPKIATGSDFDMMLGYLAKAEGLHLHWNRTEKDFTTMYGVYAYSFPRSKPVKRVRELARQKGFGNITRHNVRDLDTTLTTDEREELKHLIYEFYVKNFTNEKINKELGSKSFLSFFSISVNGGMTRGYKALQSALGVKVDGKFGSGSFRALDSQGNDIKINNGMLCYMKSFYYRLARKAKFKRYLKGWINRLIGLGYRSNIC